MINDGRLASLEAKLGPDERLRHRNFLRPLRAREFLLGRMLLRHAARHLLGPAAVRIDVVEREHHAPLVSFPALSPTPDFHFSISHSRGWIACLASTTCAIGLDIENKMHARDVEEMGAAAFDDAGRQWLENLDAQRRKEGFYRSWNNREALHKLRGNFTCTSSQEPFPLGWNCFSQEHPHLHIGVCATKELRALDVVHVENL